MKNKHHNYSLNHYAVFLFLILPLLGFVLGLLLLNRLGPAVTTIITTIFIIIATLIVRKLTVEKQLNIFYKEMFNKLKSKCCDGSKSYEDCYKQQTDKDSENSNPSKHDNVIDWRIVVSIVVICLIIPWIYLSLHERDKCDIEPTHDQNLLIERYINDLNSTNEFSQSDGAKGLAHMGPVACKAVPPLMDKLKSHNEIVFVNVAEALSSIGDKSINALIKALNSNDKMLRLRAAVAIHWFGSDARKSVPSLIKMLRDDIHNLRATAAYALTEIGPDAKEAIPQLLKALEDDNEQVRINSAMALGRIGQESLEVSIALSHILNDRNKDVRLEAAHSLAQIGRDDEKVISALIKALDDQNINVRYWSVVALGKVGRGNDRVIRSLKKSLNDNDETIRVAAETMLKKVVNK